MYWSGLQKSFGTCELDCSLRKLKKLHSRFALHLLQALMGTLPSVPMIDPLADVKPYVWETFKLGTRLNLVQSETLKK